MKNFTCWKEDEVGKTLVDDANRDAPAVFSAVHRPARVLRKDIRRGRADRGTPVTEHDVLEALLGGDPTDDRIIPVVGESGTGKSHLIRWLDANIERSEDLHVVYIEKRGTSLKQVVHKILEGLDQPSVRHHERFVELRAEVDKAAAGLDHETARLHLLSAIAFAVREHGADVTASDDELLDRQDLAESLPDLLNDPEFRVPLLADGGVIAETVARTLGEKRSDGEMPAFIDSDLDLEVQDVMRAGAAARDLRQDLYGDPEQRALAVRMLNEQINPALGAMLGLDRRQIYDVMLDVREALFAAGRTLVLLVEDFALLRGVETQLLDAMIAEAESRGERVLCPMRSALAVTSGYFEGKEGALTRIHSRGGYLYSLDAELGEAETAVGQEAVEAFVATYMNAARVGRDKLTYAFDRRAAATASSKDWLINACTECPFQEECHEAFGESEGFGLYPFNGPSLQRIINSQTEAFDPRHILQILEGALRTQHDVLTAGLFPDPEWLRRYDEQAVIGRPELRYLPAAVSTVYEQADPPTAERRKALITFWGGVPREPVNLRPAIHDAFDLAPLPDLPVLETAVATVRADSTAGGVRQRRAREEPASTQTPQPSSAEDRESLALDSWGRGGVLEQSLANRIRKALAQAVKGAREWSSFGVSKRALELLVSQSAFSLGPRARGEGSVASATLGAIQPSDANAFLLQGVLEAEARGDWSFERGLERFVTFSGLVDGWADEALRRLRPSDEAIVVATQTLLLGTAALGIAGPSDTDERLLEAIFAQPVLGERTSDARWRAYQQSLIGGPSGSASRQDLIDLLLVNTQLRRAVGDNLLPLALDSGSIMAAIAALRKNGWERVAAATESVERSIVRHGEALGRTLPEAVETHLSVVAQQRAYALGLLGGVRDAAQIADAVGAAYESARDTGVAGPDLDVNTGEREARFRGADLRALDRLKDLERVEDLKWPRRLDILVLSQREDFESIDSYLIWADQTLKAAQTAVTAGLGGRPEAGAGIASTSAQVAATIRALADELEVTR